jgi:hypothetical protein
MQVVPRFHASRVPFITIIGLLASALIIAGCGSTTAAAPTATATTAPTATPTINPALSSTFTSSDGVYTFGFPSTWSKTPVNQSPFVNGVILFSPDAKDFFVTLPANQGLPSSQYKQVLQGFLQGLPATNIKFGQTGTPTLGANTWTAIDATYTYKGTAYDSTQFGLTHNGNAFLVVVGAPHADSDTVGSTYFLPMITSLKFLK